MPEAAGSNCGLSVLKYHCVGIEVAAVVKLDAAPQVKNPGLLVSRRLLPAIGQARPQGREPVRAR
jgi:hypothetical protein